MQYPGKCSMVLGQLNQVFLIGVFFNEVKARTRITRQHLFFIGYCSKHPPAPPTLLTTKLITTSLSAVLSPLESKPHCVQFVGPHERLAHTQSTAICKEAKTK